MFGFGSVEKMLNRTIINHIHLEDHLADPDSFLPPSLHLPFLQPRTIINFSNLMPNYIYQESNCIKDHNEAKRWKGAWKCLGSFPARRWEPFGNDGQTSRRHAFLFSYPFSSEHFPRTSEGESEDEELVSDWLEFWWATKKHRSVRVRITEELVEVNQVSSYSSNVDLQFTLHFSSSSNEHMFIQTFCSLHHSIEWVEIKILDAITLLDTWKTSVKCVHQSDASVTHVTRFKEGTTAATKAVKAGRWPKEILLSGSSLISMKIPSDPLLRPRRLDQANQVPGKEAIRTISTKRKVTAHLDRVPLPRHVHFITSLLLLEPVKENILPHPFLFCTSFNS